MATIAQIAIVIIILAVLFAIVSMFVPIDDRIKRIAWLVLAAVVAIILIQWLVGFAGGGGLTLRH